jgi:phosphatidate phosphatase APP1
VRASRRLLRLLARPARSVVTAEGGVVLQAYRGYGSADEVFLIGRVYRQPSWLSGQSGRRHKRAWDDLGRLLFRRGVKQAKLQARFSGTTVGVVTDHDGYFRVHLRPTLPPHRDRAWHRMSLELLTPVRLEVEGELFVPPGGGRQVVISDIDDTVMETGVANKVRMLWRLFTEGTDHRPAFPGVAALLRALHRGASGAERNPLLYVSRAPWTLYEVLDAFFRVQAVPGGPLLFLREWGLRPWRPFPRRGRDHKLALIRHMVELYRDLPVVLIGDSAQDDPEIYCRIVREHPGRVLAVYIRNVSRERPARVRAIEALAAEVAATGSHLLLAPDSLAMAEHAAALRLIAPSAVAGIAREHAAAASAERPMPSPGPAALLEEDARPGESAVELLVDSEDRRV